MENYILSIDQSTQGTKALLFDGTGRMIERADLPHRQIINKAGWVSHDLTEIYKNTVQVVKDVIEKAQIDKDKIVGVGISNQRETAAIWDRFTGRPMADAIVWQCARAKEICERIEQEGKSDFIRQTTGIRVSPYYPAAKYAWFLENVKGIREEVDKHSVCLGTIDSFLIYQLTGGNAFKTDYSNASRTQLLNLKTLKWDEEVCDIYRIPVDALAEVCDSDSKFGETDFNGFFNKSVPIRGVLGDSHGALFGQGCLKKGSIKATYGTGSSIMMNIGEQPVISKHGVVTSLAWRIRGKVNYVLEGNINYTGGVITWLKDDLKLIHDPKETESYAWKAEQDDDCYMVPAFTGMGAPYWEKEAKAAIVGMTRKTKKAEIIRAGLDCIAYQITDVIIAMSKDADLRIEDIRVDGGPTKNWYLMQFQSDILNGNVLTPDQEELSGIGVAYVAGMALGIYEENIFQQIKYKTFTPQMNAGLRMKKYGGWLQAVESVIPRSKKQ